MTYNEIDRRVYGTSAKKYSRASTKDTISAPKGTTNYEACIDRTVNKDGTETDTLNDQKVAEKFKAKTEV